jgi:hypothetical protein
VTCPHAALTPAGLAIVAIVALLGLALFRWLNPER